MTIFVKPLILLDYYCIMKTNKFHYLFFNNGLEIKKQDK
jgi:hypothetical protein